MFDLLGLVSALIKAFMPLFLLFGIDLSALLGL